MGLFVQCLYALSLHLVSVVFGTAIPTSLYNFGKCFMYFKFTVCYIKHNRATAIADLCLKGVG